MREALQSLLKFELPVAQAIGLATGNSLLTKNYPQHRLVTGNRSLFWLRVNSADLLFPRRVPVPVPPMYRVGTVGLAFPLSESGYQKEQQKELLLWLVVVVPSPIYKEGWDCGTLCQTKENAAAALLSGYLLLPFRSLDIPVE